MSPSGSYSVRTRVRGGQGRLARFREEGEGNHIQPALRGLRPRIKAGPRRAETRARNVVCGSPKSGPPQTRKTEALELFRLRGGFCVFRLTHSNCAPNASIVFERPCGDSQVPLVRHSLMGREHSPASTRRVR